MLEATAAELEVLETMSAELELLEVGATKLELLEASAAELDGLCEGLVEALACLVLARDLEDLLV